MSSHVVAIATIQTNLDLHINSGITVIIRMTTNIKMPMTSRNKVLLPMKV